MYRRGTPPDDLSNESLLAWVLRELESVERSQAETSVLELRPVNAEPSKRVEGMIVFADGTDWNPGAGKGVYTYLSGAWSKL